jgi:hypothetical protein
MVAEQHAERAPQRFDEHLGTQAEGPDAPNSTASPCGVSENDARWAEG